MHVFMSSISQPCFTYKPKEPCPALAMKSRVSSLLTQFYTSQRCGSIEQSDKVRILSHFSLSHKPLVIRYLVLHRGTQRRFPPQYIENTFQAIQSTFRYLEMNSERRYKICKCSVILRQLESLRSHQGSSISSPKNLKGIQFLRN